MSQLVRFHCWSLHISVKTIAFRISLPFSVCLSSVSLFLFPLISYRCFVVSPPPLLTYHAFCLKPSCEGALQILMKTPPPIFLHGPPFSHLPLFYPSTPPSMILSPSLTCPVVLGAGNIAVNPLILQTRGANELPTYTWLLLTHDQCPQSSPRKGYCLDQRDPEEFSFSGTVTVGKGVLTVLSKGLCGSPCLNHSCLQKPLLPITCVLRIP